MSALIKDRNTLQREGDEFSHPVAASAKIYAGAITCLDAAGNAVPGSTALNLTAVGRAEVQADNTSGQAGDIDVLTRKGVFSFANDATNTIARTDIGSNAYIVDDQTVASTDGAGTRSVAGEIVDVDADGVWIKLG